MAVRRSPLAAVAAVATVLSATALTSGAAYAAPSTTQTPAPSETGAVATNPIADELLASAGELPGPAAAVGVTDEHLFVQTGSGPSAQVHWRPLTGGAWGTDWAGTSLAGELVATEGDVVQLTQGDHDVLVWTRDGGGHRSVPTGTDLGDGARNVAYYDAQRGRVVAQPVTATTETRIEALYGTHDVSVVGDDVFLSRTSLGAVTRHNLVTGEEHGNWNKCVAGGRGTGTGMADSVIGGRVALVTCANGPVLSDVEDIYQAIPVTGLVEPETALLGAGFVLGRGVGDVLTVVPFLSGTPGTLGAASSFDLDDARDTVVYVAQDGSVRTADLGGRAVELATQIVDTTPPTVWPLYDDTPQSSPGVPASTQLVVSAMTADAGTFPYAASRIATTEIRYRVKGLGAAEFGEYVVVSAPSSGVTARAEVPQGSTFCAEGRGTDRRGNVSGWSEPLCRTVPLVLGFGEPWTRVAGADRYLTAVEVSRQFAPEVPVAYVASGRKFPDALSASAAAARLGGPLLLTDPATLPAAVADELRRLTPRRIVVVGAQDSVGANVEAALRSIAPTTRIGGTNRYATSLGIVADAFTSAEHAIVATGRTFPDALSAGAAAGSVGAPVILVDGAAASVPQATLTVMRELGVSSVTVVGGTPSVSDSIQAQLVGERFAVVRLGGYDRYSTAAMIAHRYFPADTRPMTFLATGENFPDALSGAALAGQLDAPLLLSRRTCLPPATHEQLLYSPGSHLVSLGGAASIAPGVVEQQVRCAG